MRRVNSAANKKRDIFVIFKCFGVVKVAQIGLVKREVFKINNFVKKISTIDRTLTPLICLVKGY